MSDHIGQRFLQNPVERRLDVGLLARKVLRAAEGELEVRLASETLDEDARGGGQPNMIQHRGVELEGHRADLLQRLVNQGTDQLNALPPGSDPALLEQKLEVEPDGSHRLTDAVMELSCNTRPFLFLNRGDSRGKRLQSAGLVCSGAVKPGIVQHERGRIGNA